MRKLERKPPIGIYPEWLWREQRCIDLVAAINRYLDVGLEPLPAWQEELLRHKKWLRDYKYESKGG